MRSPKSKEPGTKNRELRFRSSWNLGLFSFFFLLSSLHGLAQTDTLKTEDIEIINIYEPVISDAFKSLETPKIIDTTPPPITVRYELLKCHLKTEFHIDTIKAATMKSESLPKLYKSHVKLGAGNHFITFADASFHNLRSREQSYGGRFRHYGAYNPSLNNTFSQFSENNLKLFGTKFLADHAISGEADHSRDVIHFFGFNADSFPNITKSSIRQRFAKTSGKAEIMSFFKDSTALNYDVFLKYYNLSDLYKAQENNIFLNADLNRFYGKENIQISTSLDFNNLINSYDSTSGSNGILKIHPHIISQGKKWRLNAGLGIFADVGNSANFSFKPIAEFRYHIVSDLIIPYAGINGKISRNSFKLFTDENPFLISAFSLKNSNYTEVYAGIRGAESSEISFNLIASMSQAKDMAFFVLDTFYLPQNKFTVIYDDVDVTNIRAEVTYEKNEKMKFIFSGDYFSYQTYYETNAWYKPQFKGNISAFYNLQDKIILKADVFGISEQFAKSYDSTDVATSFPGIYYKKLNGILDANLGIEYRYNNRLSAFINLNNLGAVRYYRWEKYPTMRFNILGGVSYSF